MGRREGRAHRWSGTVETGGTEGPDDPERAVGEVPTLSLDPGFLSRPESEVGRLTVLSDGRRRGTVGNQVPPDPDGSLPTPRSVYVRRDRDYVVASTAYPVRSGRRPGLRERRICWGSGPCVCPLSSGPSVRPCVHRPLGPAPSGSGDHR